MRFSIEDSTGVPLLLTDLEKDAKPGAVTPPKDVMVDLQSTDAEDK